MESQEDSKRLLDKNIAGKNIIDLDILGEKVRSSSMTNLEGLDKV